MKEGCHVSRLREHVIDGKCAQHAHASVKHGTHFISPIGFRQKAIAFAAASSFSIHLFSICTRCQGLPLISVTAIFMVGKFPSGMENSML